MSEFLSEKNTIDTVARKPYELALGRTGGAIPGAIPGPFPAIEIGGGMPMGAIPGGGMPFICGSTSLRKNQGKNKL